MKQYIAMAMLALFWAGCNRAPSTPPATAEPATNKAMVAAAAAPAAPTTFPDSGTLERARALKDEGKLADARAALALFPERNAL